MGMCIIRLEELTSLQWCVCAWPKPNRDRLPAGMRAGDDWMKPDS
jgi:hypothetical protein